MYLMTIFSKTPFSGNLYTGGGSRLWYHFCLFCTGAFWEFLTLINETPRNRSWAFDAPVTQYASAPVPKNPGHWASPCKVWWGPIKSLDILHTQCFDIWPDVTLTFDPLQNGWLTAIYVWNLFLAITLYWIEILTSHFVKHVQWNLQNSRNNQ